MCYIKQLSKYVEIKSAIFCSLWLFAQLFYQASGSPSPAEEVFKYPFSFYNFLVNILIYYALFFLINRFIKKLLFLFCGILNRRSLLASTYWKLPTVFSYRFTAYCNFLIRILLFHLMAQHIGKTIIYRVGVSCLQLTRSLITVLAQSAQSLSRAL